MLWKTLLILSLLKKITTLSLNDQKGKKLCEPVYNCPPGSEIISCLHKDSLKDECMECKAGYEQPDYISSGMSDVTCFKPNSTCLADDITFGRGERNSFCDSLSGCKCNTLLCYYGDPCLCDKKSGCSENKFLKANGECVPCPRGSGKNGTGCGPCLYQSTQSYMSVHIDVKDTTTVDNRLKEYMFQETSKPSTFQPGNTGYTIEEEYSAVPCIPFVVVIVCMTLIIIFMAIVLYRNRRGLSICGSTANIDNTHHPSERVPMNEHTS